MLSYDPKMHPSKHWSPVSPIQMMVSKELGFFKGVQEFQVFLPFVFGGKICVTPGNSGL